MKWSNKGHELDLYAKKLISNFNAAANKIYIFGAGLIGNDIRPVIEHYGCFAGFIDNDREKQLRGVNGVSVISLDEYLANEKRGQIVIAADKENIPNIEKQLLNAGLVKDRDFWGYVRFVREIFPILTVYEYDSVFVELAQICLTERCSLKCKDCAHGCYAVDAKKSDMNIEAAKSSADYFFSRVDVVKEFVLIGGEPFLYRGLEDIIEYIGEKYREKIIIFSITTNGTIIPRQTILELCRKYDVLIRISNYSSTIGYLGSKYMQLEQKLKNEKVLYVLGDKENLWMDYGFRTVDRKENADELMEVFNNCKTPCREIRENRYYYCVMARSVSENLNFNVGTDDYLDFSALGDEYKKVILEFQLGYSEKGYLDMCNYCHGADAVKYPISAAVQL